MSIKSSKYFEMMEAQPLARPPTLLETSLFIAALWQNAPSDAGFFIFERDSHPYDGHAQLSPYVVIL